MTGHFPQFRKLANNQSYYQIDSPENVIEIQKLGERWTLHQLHAKILPERLHISDILQGLNGTYITISEDEFEKFRSYCLRHLKKF